MVNELRQKSANQISDKIDAEELFTYFRKLSTPHNSAKSGFEKLVDINVPNLKLLNSQNQMNQSYTNQSRLKRYVKQRPS